MKTIKQHKAEIDALTNTLDVAERDRDSTAKAWQANSSAANLDANMTAIDVVISARRNLANAQRRFKVYVGFLRAELHELKEGQL